MKSQTTLGRFVSRMLTLAAQASPATNVPGYPRTKVVAQLPLLRFMVICLSRQLAKEASPSYRVFRYSSTNQNSSSSSLQEC